MNIFCIFTKRHGFMTSLEDRGTTPADEFQSSFNTDPNRFTTFSGTCSESVYSQIADKAGTLEAPALIASATSEKHPTRISVYVENGALKIKA